MFLIGLYGDRLYLLSVSLSQTVIYSVLDTCDILIRIFCDKEIADEIRDHGWNVRRHQNFYTVHKYSRVYSSDIFDLNIL